MDDKLVTVAIHTYEKAQILKTVLESEGIPASISNVGLIQPVVSSGVRVRIREIDLAKALNIIENLNLETEYSKSPKTRLGPKREIVVPIDFSEFSMKACTFAFNFAFNMLCEVKIINAYFTPFYPAAIPFGETFTVQAAEDATYKDYREKIAAQMKTFCQNIDKEIAAGSFPNVNYSTELLEGLPEDEIIAYAKKEHPFAIVMGTRGSNKKELDLIGSVTAEVIEGVKTPIFAIPEKAMTKRLSSMKKVAFLTNFNQREFVAFEILMNFLSKASAKVYLAHIAKDEDMWDEMKLAGIIKYFEEHYPSLDFEYKLIGKNKEKTEEVLDKFVKDNDIELIALSGARRNILARIFNPGIARRMIFHSDTPLVVLKS